MFLISAFVRFTTDLETMRHEIVQVHNEYRHQHGCPGLFVTTELAREAQQWADLLAMRGLPQYNDSLGNHVFS